MIFDNVQINPDIETEFKEVSNIVFIRLCFC